MLQEILNFLLDRRFKKICDFLNPHLPFYGKATVAQEMTEEIVEIADIEEAKDDYEEDPQIDSEILTIDYTVEIVNTFEVGSIKKYTMYKIETRGQNKYFEASHRFQDFKKLHGELIKIIPTLGELPSSSLTKFSTSREVVNERKICLEKYLQGILQIQELQGYRPVVEFLNLHKSVS